MKPKGCGLPGGTKALGRGGGSAFEVIGEAGAGLLRNALERRVWFSFTDGTELVTRNIGNPRPASGRGTEPNDSTLVAFDDWTDVVRLESVPRGTSPEGLFGRCFQKPRGQRADTLGSTSSESEAALSKR